MSRVRALALAGLICVTGGLAPSAADALPQNFSDTTVFQGLNAPTSVAFAPDGRIFVAEQGGLIKVFDGPSDTTATTFADLRTQVHGFWDRGLESLIIDPQFPTRPYVYVSYTYDAPIGGTAPTWGTAGQNGDGCSSPPGATDDGCVVSGRLSRLTVAGNGTGNTIAANGEKVLINDWCQQYPSHSVGDLGFGADGNLYMSGGDGASFVFADYGQDGNPVNPCGDPPFGVGSSGTQATGEGGALRSQDIRTSGDPLGLDGTVIRVDPDTGNPVSGSGNTGRVVAFGFRNPFRFAIRPGTNPPEVWVGDVGWGTVEEIDRVQTQAGVSGTTGNNFGWPCLEGPTYKPYSDEGFCQSLYTKTGAEAPKAPYFSFIHGQRVDPAESAQPAGTCTLDGGSSITGMEFYDGGSGASGYPSAYDGSLFFADYARNCIWVMKAGTNGLPDATKVGVFEGTLGPVDLENAPDGSLYYVSLSQGKVHRIAYESDNRAPVARATATPDHGNAPLAVQLSATGSSDADGDALTYAWDLDGDGQFDDSPSVSPSKTYSTPGEYRPRVRVTDPDGATGTADVAVNVGGPPVPKITSPAVGVMYDANQIIQFSGSATDPDDGSIPNSGLHWATVIHHCTVVPDGCHTHNVQTFDDISSGQIAMPGHGRPYYLTLTLTATDSDGLQASASRDIYPNPNIAPVARATATPDHGTAPFEVQLDASGSTDANPGDRLSYSWDLDDDGVFDDSTSVNPTHVYSNPGHYVPKVMVRDQDGLWSTDEVGVDVEAPNVAPTPEIHLPAAGAQFSAGERISFSGGATDAEDGELPPSALSWRLLGPNCPGPKCVEQPLSGVNHGEAVAPSRVNPYELRLELTATDSDGASATTEMALEPRVARLTVKSRRNGARASIERTRGKVPLERTVLQGADVRVATPAHQHAPGFGSKKQLEWRRWSDDGERVHTVALTSDTVLRAGYRVVPKPARSGRDR